REPPSPAGRPRPWLPPAADALGLSLLYVPSMRNGRAAEDRGNAILATMRLDDLEAIELPLDRQRGVAIAATIRLRARRPITLRIVSTHFTNVVGHHLWLFSEPGRIRQARALAS